jgi:RNA polymerase sigma-70 factor (ECF subfamily)
MEIRLKARVEEADERLLVEAAQQDPRRFGELYERNFDRVYAFVPRRVASRAEAEDVTAEVFHRALVNLPRFQWRGVPFASWLLRIATNTAADQQRRAGRKRLDPAPEIAAPETSDARQVEEEERSARLFRLVQQLPADQRRVVRLRFAEEKSIHKVAQELGRSEGAVKQLQFRALENLRA